MQGGECAVKDDLRPQGVWASPLQDMGLALLLPLFWAEWGPRACPPAHPLCTRLHGQQAADGSRLRGGSHPSTCFLNLPEELQSMGHPVRIQAPSQASCGGQEGGNMLSSHVCALPCRYVAPHNHLGRELSPTSTGPLLREKLS